MTDILDPAYLMQYLAEKYGINLDTVRPTSDKER